MINHIFTAVNYICLAYELIVCNVKYDYLWEKQTILITLVTVICPFVHCPMATIKQIVNAKSRDFIILKNEI